MRRKPARVVGAALALDNVGTGLYLPVAALFLIQIRNLSVADAGIVLGVGTAVGLAVPALAGVLVDRVGARYVLSVGQALQAGAMAGYLALPGWGGALVASAVYAAGTQLFYGSLFALLSGLKKSQGSLDKSFAAMDMLRAAAFGGGALLGAGFLAFGGTSTGWLLVGNMILSASAALMILAVPIPGANTDARSTAGTQVLRDRPFMGLILLCFLVSVIGDFFPLAFPVVAVEQLSAPTWLPSLCLAILTITGSTLTLSAVHLTRRRSRAFAVALGLGVLIGWVGLSVTAYFVSSDYVIPLLLTSTLVFAAGSVLVGTRLHAAARDAAPSQSVGRYLAAFQYAFSLAGLTAPLLLAAFDIGYWLPWSLLALAAIGALGLLRPLGRVLPPGVLDADVRGAQRALSDRTAKEETQ